MTLTGLELGRRTTKTVCARIYDKTLQVKEKGKVIQEARFNEISQVNLFGPMSMSGASEPTCPTSKHSQPSGRAQIHPRRRDTPDSADWSESRCAWRSLGNGCPWGLGLWDCLGHGMAVARSPTSKLTLAGRPRPTAGVSRRLWAGRTR